MEDRDGVAPGKGSLDDRKSLEQELERLRRQCALQEELLDNLTRSRDAAEALRESEARYRQLIELSPEPIVVLREGRIRYVNDAAVALLGTDSVALLGRNIDDFLEEEVDGLRAIARGDDTRVLVEVNQAPASPESPAVQLIMRDVTAREDERRRMVMVDRLVSMGTLAAGVAHEIASPLAYVLGNVEHGVELTRGDPRFAELHEALEEARHGALQVRSLLRNLRTFTRGDGTEAMRIDVVATLESALKLSWNAIRRRAKLIKSFEFAPPVLTTAPRLGQVFLNLLINAAQAIPLGHPERHSITVTTKQVQGNAVIEISDTGVGIEPAVVERIFQPFFTTKPPGTGTGLGLGICRDIVTELGGTLEVESELGVGTMFRVTIPGEGGTPESTRQPSFVPADEQARVLVVDDDHLVAQALRRVLRGHDIVAVSDVDAALEVLGDSHFDAILCDYFIAHRSGLELLDAIGETHPGLERRFALITGARLDGDNRRLLASKGVEILEKPFDMATVRAFVQQCISRSS